MHSARGRRTKSDAGCLATPSGDAAQGKPASRSRASSVATGHGGRARRHSDSGGKSPSGSSSDGTFIIRVTPTLNNVHLATPTSKAQLLCLNRSSGEQAALTFRTRHPGLTPHLVRAAKVRFIVQSLPHLRGSSVDSYVRFELKYRDYFAPKPHKEALIRELMKSTLAVHCCVGECRGVRAAVGGRGWVRHACAAWWCGTSPPRDFRPSPWRFLPQSKPKS